MQTPAGRSQASDVLVTPVSEMTPLRVDEEDPQADQTFPGGDAPTHGAAEPCRLSGMRRTRSHRYSGLSVGVQFTAAPGGEAQAFAAATVV